MGIIERRLKYIKFTFDEKDSAFVITTYDKDGETVIGQVGMSKTYMFSTIRFLVSMAQRMTRGFPAWVKKRKKQLK